MRKTKKRDVVLTIGIRVTQPELKQIKLIMSKRRINSYSHALRVLIAEEAEKILTCATISSVASNRSTCA